MKLNYILFVKVMQEKINEQEKTIVVFNKKIEGFRNFLLN